MLKIRSLGLILLERKKLRVSEQGAGVVWRPVISYQKIAIIQV